MHILNPFLIIMNHNGKKKKTHRLIFDKKKSLAKIIFISIIDDPTPNHAKMFIKGHVELP